MPVVLSDHHRRCILLVALAYLCVLLHGPSYAVSAESLFIDKVTYYESGVSEAAEPGPMPTIWNWTASRSRHLAPGGGGLPHHLYALCRAVPLRVHLARQGRRQRGKAAPLEARAGAVHGALAGVLPRWRPVARTKPILRERVFLGLKQWFLGSA